MSLPFLLEIGTEEIPDWMIEGALASLKSQLEGLGIAAQMDATPRRLTARAEGLPERLPDTEERVMGPPRAANPKAVEGFARKLGVRPEDLAVESTAKGEYYTHLRKVPGRKMIDILAESLPGIIQSGISSVPISSSKGRLTVALPADRPTPAPRPPPACARAGSRRPAPSR